MKKLIIFASIVLLCCGLSYAEEIELPHITVFGTAVKKVTPDSMSWHLTVKNNGLNLQEVAELHTKNVEAVLTLLKKLKVETKETQTSRMEFGENMVYRDRSQVKEGYFASTQISFKITDFQKYKPLWMGLSQIENVTVGGVNYAHSNIIDFQNETRKQALLVAKEKAVALAETLGSKIGEPLLIEEDASSQGYRASPNYWNTVSIDGVALPGSDKGEGIAPGTIPIRMKMKLVFRLITHEN